MATSYRYSIPVQRYWYRYLKDNRYWYIRYVASDVAAYVNHRILLNLVSCTSTITTNNNSMEKSYLLGSRHDMKKLHSVSSPLTGTVPRNCSYEPVLNFSTEKMRPNIYIQTYYYSISTLRYLVVPY
eukprot:SAG11_NODE_308_length_10943_cov_6.679609_3_plen_127_part_00